MKRYDFRPLGLLGFLGAGLPFFGNVGLAPLQAAQYAPPTSGESATFSRLEGFTFFQLPDNGKRINDAGLIQDLSTRVKTYAAEQGQTLAATEFVTWQIGSPDDSRNANIREVLMYTFKGAGYDFVGDAENGREAGLPTRFIARRNTDKRVAVGVWLVRDGYLSLGWGYAGAPKETPATTESVRPTPIGPSHDVLPQAPTRSGRKIPTPADMVGGTWKWTTISSVGYVNTQTNQLAGPSGMSARFSFTSDGHYKYFFYINQRTYNMVNEATTTEDGTVSFNDDGTFVMRPSRGHYKGTMPGKVIDRDMTTEERKPRTYYWEWRTVSGKRQLYIGPSRSSLSHFERE